PGPGLRLEDGQAAGEAPRRGVGAARDLAVAFCPCSGSSRPCPRSSTMTSGGTAEEGPRPGRATSRCMPAEWPLQVTGQPRGGRPMLQMGKLRQEGAEQLLQGHDGKKLQGEIRAPSPSKAKKTRGSWAPVSNYKVMGPSSDTLNCKRKAVSSACQGQKGPSRQD
ncbi:hypothetical protein H1C71_028741, partial [Ictidomys tridecemlineatus]